VLISYPTHSINMYISSNTTLNVLVTVSQYGHGPLFDSDVQILSAQCEVNNDNIKLIFSR
jgi:hypothetical protein